VPIFADVKYMVHVLTVFASRLTRSEQRGNNGKPSDRGNSLVSCLRAGLFACTERESICLELSSMSYAGDLNEVTSTWRRSLPVTTSWTQFIIFGNMLSHPLITDRVEMYEDSVSCYGMYWIVSRGFKLLWNFQLTV